MKFVHVMIFEKFIRSYIEFLDENFDINEHSFLIVGKDYGTYDLKDLPNVVFINNVKMIPAFVAKLYSAERIFIHGLWDRRVMQILSWNPWLIKKCYWLMWGGDFYNYRQEPAVKKKLIKKIRHFVTMIKGDFEFVKNKYGAKGTLHECIGYPVQLVEYIGAPVLPPSKEKVDILLGNSADPSNRHIEALDILKQHDAQIGSIICPLSYGNKGHAASVTAYGQELFGERFIALTDFMPFEKYNELLKTIDVAVFNHLRQQGLGNITSMLAKGKKVFLVKENPCFAFFNELGIGIFNMENFTATPLEEMTMLSNTKKMGEYFSKANFIHQLNNLFYS